MEYLIIDRFEGEIAVCERENKEYIPIPISSLPLGCKEGSCLYADQEGNLHIDKSYEKEREKRIKSLMDSLFE